MTEKVHKILSEIATRKLCTMDEHMAFYNDKAKEDYRFLSEIEEIIRGMQKEPVSEDLDKAANEYAKTEYNRKNPATLPDRCIGCYAPIIYAFKAGAQWQKHQDDLIIKQTKTYYRLLGKQQMKEELMKDAVNMTVGYWMPNGLRLDVDETENDWGLDEGDKVKVIVIKEE